MTIKQNIVKPSQYPTKCPYPMEAVGICVHNTANDASAKNEINYMVGNNLKVSFHFAVDDIEVWQGLPLDRNGWHAGDGQGAGNRKHIGIEICYSKSGGERFIKAENNTVTLIVKLLKERGWGVEKVKKHQDFSGKYCPHRTLDLGWERFIKQIEAQMGGVIINPSNDMSKLTEEIYNQSKSALPDQSYNFEDQLDKAKFKDELVVVKFNSLDEERRWRSDRVKEIDSLKKTIEELSKPIITTTPSNAPQTGDNFEAVTEPPLEVKPDLPTYSATEFEPFEWLWNKISNLWKR